MFDKVKALNNLRKTQAEMKKQLEQIFISYSSRGVEVLVRGDKKIEKVELDGIEQKELRDALNDAMKQVDKKVEKQMRGQLSDLGIPGL
ncbi:MAG: YbaB/EbfC family nucleoid-associated protein [Patescibacteria group bacterium]|jgi:DNA-binding protein YbaB